MSATTYNQLLHQAFPDSADATRYLSKPTLAAYQDLERASRPELSFRFERVRLAVAMALMKLLADLGDHADSRAVLDLMHRALRAGSTKEIDAIVTKEGKLFDRLYSNLYVNEQGEQLLNLFGETLEADSIAGMDELMAEALELARELDFTQEEDEEEETE
ncbi:hypothetical protein H8B15_07420 [Hymenobacter sp. BT507]|uniref:Uncharacterized protein n=1 Tax=Hymenobacter citatus TaxID=2763506 RepID=A0ABR7MI66_9BACT|nr:hypothetical protein [Hymenobacter citatus]MBC6610747.1 hypothetical protein [Hymenobacter citatus]